MSAQASSFHYCSPRVDLSESYDSVEVGFPSSQEEKLEPYSEHNGIYTLVPVDIVDEIIRNMVEF